MQKANETKQVTEKAELTSQCEQSIRVGRISVKLLRFLEIMAPELLIAFDYTL